VNQETLRELAEELIRFRIEDTDKRDAHAYLTSQGVLAQGREAVELADKVHKATITITWEA
jgi:hypothetical protein